ncbi:MAG: PIN domain nuclease [Candidatus Omnitrophica bacterium CG11_big_fil_rev_8_21_14_0_20_42_13]|uniref:PIN domain nuclease n=1 Tax=Candidatus Ghiorseimicrobium undicola TaxID=1974746 RepID=A0A2H0LW48_9BACT|nr:MAG: PIN domain nuclease [Candidatus Omnitrophica bacterium CG11_big_fil_rev_8_21_14_0_20_42_13]
MTMLFIRIFFAVGSIAVGYQTGQLVDAGIVGSITGGVVAGLIIILERGMRTVSTRGLSSVVFGLILGLIMSKLVSDALQLMIAEADVLLSTRLVVTLVLCYLGMALALRGREEFNIIIPYVRLKRHDQGEDIIILDTSAIIDGRIIDICKAKFISARLVVPRFVLKELQQIADSSDYVKRQRGRRGLDILHSLQKTANLSVTVHEESFPDIKEVDAKIVQLAKLLDAKILTLDFNLNKVAEIQGATVLNINELANALKPVVYPGEIMEVKLLKEGKEHDQAIGYLDDGTMIVVEDGRRLIGKTVKSVVTSVLQTQAGRMIFTKTERR